MKKTSVTVLFDTEKTDAARIYLAKKNSSLEAELEKYMSVLFEKNVPANVRDFLNMKFDTKSDNAERVPNAHKAGKPENGREPAP